MEADAAGLVEHFERGWSQGTTASFGAFDAHSGAFAGLVVAMMPTEPHVAEVAYWVDPAARGHGVATRAVRLLSAWALRSLGVQRLWLEIEPGNEASHGVAARAGYRREGVLRSHCRDRRTGRRHDCVIYSLLPGD